METEMKGTIIEKQTINVVSEKNLKIDYDMLLKDFHIYRLKYTPETKESEGDLQRLFELNKRLEARLTNSYIFKVYEENQDQTYGGYKSFILLEPKGSTIFPDTIKELKDTVKGFKLPFDEIESGLENISLVTRLNLLLLLQMKDPVGLISKLYIVTPNSKKKSSTKEESSLVTQHLFSQYTKDSTKQDPKACLCDVVQTFKKVKRLDCLQKLEDKGKVDSEEKKEKKNKARDYYYKNIGIHIFDLFDIKACKEESIYKSKKEDYETSHNLVKALSIQSIKEKKDLYKYKLTTILEWKKRINSCKYVKSMEFDSVDLISLLADDNNSYKKKQENHSRCPKPLAFL